MSRYQSVNYPEAEWRIEMSSNQGRQVLGKPTLSFMSPGLAVPAGRLVFISGQVPLDDNGNVVGDDMTTQARDVFDKITALVEEAGGSISNVVKITAFLTDMSRMKEYASVREEVFKPNYPASSSVEVSALVPPVLIEVEAIAVLDSDVYV
jgi:2-iminobutanoate/2-iminopropanoate deaminase